MNPDSRMTPDALTALLAAEFEQVDKRYLRIHAEAILEHSPAFPSALELIIAEPRDNPGRQAAMEFFDRIINETIKDRTRRTPQNTPVTITPALIKENAISWWADDPHKPHDKEGTAGAIVRKWALTNAAYETAETSLYLFSVGSTFSDLIYLIDAETFSSRYHYHHLSHKIDGLRKDTIEKTYWRGLAAFDRIGCWADSVQEGYDFIMWAGKQDDINAVIRAARNVRPLDIEVVKEELANENRRQLPIPSRDEINGIIKRNAIVNDLAYHMQDYGTDTLKMKLAALPQETLSVLVEYSKTGLMRKSTIPVITKAASPASIHEAVYYSTRLNIDAGAYRHSYAPLLRHYEQLPHADDYSAVEEHVRDQCAAIITVTEAAIIAADNWDSAQTILEEKELENNWVDTIRDSRIVNLVFDQPQYANQIADLIMNRNIIDADQLSDILEKMQNSAPSMIEGTL